MSIFKFFLSKVKENCELKARFDSMSGPKIHYQCGKYLVIANEDTKEDHELISMVITDDNILYSDPKTIYELLGNKNEKLLEALIKEAEMKLVGLLNRIFVLEVMKI